MIQGEADSIMQFAAIYAIVVGVLTIGQWIFFLATNQVPELKTEPLGIRFHLAAEFVTAIALISAGAGLLTEGNPWIRFHPPIIY